MKIKGKLMDADGMANTFRRLAHQIVERNGGVDDLSSSASARAALPSRNGSKHVWIRLKAAIFRSAFLTLLCIGMICNRLAAKWNFSAVKYLSGWTEKRFSSATM